MGGNGWACALIIVLVIVVIAWFLYNKCKLDKYLAPEHRKCGAPAGNFVGAMAHSPPLVPCAFPTSPSWELNRCNYM